jgi:hypothetical protein
MWERLFAAQFRVPEEDDADCAVMPHMQDTCMEYGDEASKLPTLFLQVR